MDPLLQIDVHKGIEFLNDLIILKYFGPLCFASQRSVIIPRLHLKEEMLRVLPLDAL